jgi:hypothetical protein
MKDLKAVISFGLPGCLFNEKQWENSKWKKIAKCDYMH